ncbi:MAG: cell division protein FtsZ [Bacteroidales bacterium]|jgi:cell division protein FtsZ|nr:cell division protein FtsZ [Bacteroidales bacterium]
MEDNTNTGIFGGGNTSNALFAFDSPKGQSSYIKVIGVGGGGGNAVNHMYRQGIHGVDFIVCNTDMKALNASPVPNKIPLGDLGLGAGNKPERARKAALDKADDIREAISHNTQMLFITAGMGGGTGTGAAPVIAEIAKSIELDNEDTKHILVVAIVTLPFSFENKTRREQAQAGIAELRKHVDSILIINNDKLRSFTNFRLSEAFGMANDVLLTAAKGIAEIITVDAYVNIDFQDVNTVMENSGTALMGAGSGKGEGRALEAITAASTSVLLNDNDIRGAKNVLLYFSYSADHEITMDELGEITDFVSEKTDGTADVIWGAGTDDTLDDELKVTLIATGFEKSAVDNSSPKVYELPEDLEPKKPVEQEKTVEQPKDEPFIFQKPAEETPIAETVCNVESTMPVAETIKVAEQVEQEPVRNVYVLEVEEDEPSIDEAREKARMQVEQAKKEAEDVLVEDIHVINKVEEKAAEVKPEVQPFKAPDPVSISRSAFENDNDVKTVADRIRHIHDLLRSSPTSAEQVHRMTTNQLTEDALYEGTHSSSREASSITMRADGTMAKNSFVFGNQPD